MNHTHYKTLENAANDGIIEDELNPIFIFSLTAGKLLSRIAKGEIDIQYLAKRELANRGNDLNGNWIGFNEAMEHNFK